ncbi:MAG: DUF6515 family protein [Paludibacteraceae bacterium]|nr:DUF6515 family protein [Paludibacteraceae bacterium]
MNKNFFLALLSAGIMLFPSANVFAQRGAAQHGSSPAPTNTSRNAPGASASKPAAAPSHSAAPTKSTSSSHLSPSVAPAASTSTKSATPVRHTVGPTMQQKGKHAQTATTNKKLPAKKVTPSDNYKKMYARGHEVSKHHAVSNSHHISHNNVSYYYKKGVFYKYHNNKYIVSRPPVGVCVASIPNPRIVVVNHVQYYYYYGVYYRMTPTHQYEVVHAPVGAVVESIPEGYEKLIIDGETYYIVDGVQYKAVIYDGEIWYEVIKIID